MKITQSKYTNAACLDLQALKTLVMPLTIFLPNTKNILSVCRLLHCVSGQHDHQLAVQECEDRTRPGACESQDANRKIT